METKAPPTSRLRILTLSLLPATYALFFTLPVQAASLSISPGTRSLITGESFAVNVLVVSPDQSINAAEGTISFPPDKLQAVSLATNDSIFNLWVKEPSFSNALGIIDFSGVILQPGFSGVAGKIFTVSFKTRKAGSAPVAFINGSVLANDGKGTNILEGFGDANYFLVARPIPSPTSAPPLEKPSLNETKESSKEPSKEATSTTSSADKSSSSLPGATEETTPVIQPERLASGIQLFVLAVLLGLFFIMGRLWQRFTETHQGLKKIEGKTEMRVESLLQDIRKQVITLEEIEAQRQLTVEEKEILGDLKRELDKAVWYSR